jgi:hypothetical protein
MKNIIGNVIGCIVLFVVLCVGIYGCHLALKAMGGDYIDEPHPCHDHPERLCIGHCADLKLRKDRIESPISVPQDTPRETKPDLKTLMDAWGNDGGTVDDYQE